MGRYNESNDGYVARRGTTALGIVGTTLGSLALLNQNNNCNSGCGNNGILGNIFGTNNNNCYVTEKEFNWAQVANAQDAKIAKLEAERYTDSVGTELYRELVAEGRRIDDKQSESISVINAELVRMREENATLKSDLRCLAVTNQSEHQALSNEFTAALNAEAQIRKCDDEKLFTYVNSNFIKGELKLAAADICPEVQLKCPDVQLVELINTTVAKAINTLQIK